MELVVVRRRVRIVAAAVRSLVSIRANFEAVRDALSLARRHHALIVELGRRELGSQFEGQALGKFWVIGHPMILLLVYIFVFVIVFKIRVPAGLAIPRDYTVYVLAGLVPWLAIQQSLVRSTSSLLAQSNLVRQVVFPIEILPIGAIVVPLIPEAIGLAVLAAYTLIRFGGVPWTYVLLPLAVGFQVATMVGVGFVLAALTPFLRDIKELVAVGAVIGVYLVPAFYPPEWVQGIAKMVISANPLSHLIWVFQDVLYFGSIEHPSSWAVALLMSCLSVALGYRAFRALKPYVANVL
jgi:lipopolysaccharide transport system permease protein